jgi:hypothetical protein
MRALLIRRPWIDMILDGQKTLRPVGLLGAV